MADRPATWLREDYRGTLNTYLVSHPAPSPAAQAFIDEQTHWTDAWPWHESGYGEQHLDRRMKAVNDPPPLPWLEPLRRWVAVQVPAAGRDERALLGAMLDQPALMAIALSSLVRGRVPLRRALRPCMRCGHISRGSRA